MTELDVAFQEKRNSGTAWTRNEKFDKDGDYVKKWVPELRKVPKKFIHKTWEIYDENILMLNKDYPSPVVNHEEARSRALAAFKKI